MRNILIASLAILTLSQFETAMANDKKPVNCATDLRKIEVNVDGRKVLRYDLSNPDLLKCVTPYQPSAPWRVTKTAWSNQDELNWQSFVKGIGQAIQAGRCSTVDSCLISSANPYRDHLDMAGAHYSDCADFPMYLRAYFAYKNNLPFTFGRGLSPNAPTEAQKAKAQELVDKAYASGNSAAIDEALKAQEELVDLSKTDRRYSRNGNYFEDRYTVPAATTVSRDFFVVAKALNDVYSSGSLRMLFTPKNKTLPDYYSPVINTQGIIPGTVVYKVTGHVAMVYDINNTTGEIRLMDAHPDNSVTTISYSSEFVKSNPVQGDGFKNWRPVTIQPTKLDPYGAILAGRTVMTPNEQIPTFSLEQYFGNVDMSNISSSKGQYVIGKNILDWFDYVKVRMTNGRYRLDPIAQMKADVNALCTAMKDRVKSVDTAITNGIDDKTHPSQLPNNIFGAEGEWESYSTPGRDLRLRTLALDIIAKAKTYMRKWTMKEAYFAYNGDNLKRDLIKAYADASASCVVTYKNSNKQSVNLTFPVALKRLTTISFDPYLCAERRWGASSQAELRSCGDDAEKAAWYRYQQFLRNATVREATGGWTLDELEARNANASNQSANFDILKKLNEL